MASTQGGKDMKNLVKELKEEILGKELELNDLDNICQRILNTSSSIFGYDERQIIDVGNFSYLVQSRDMCDSGSYSEYVNVFFEMIEDNENELKIRVKVTEIEEI